MTPSHLPRAAALLLALGLARAAVAQGQAAPVPEIVTQGLDLLVSGKSDQAVSVWTHAWQGDDRDKAATLSESLTSLGDVLGQVHGYDLVKSFDVSPTLRRFYYIVRYRRQPLYASFVVYRPDTAWTVINVSWNTDGATVFPKELLGPVP